MVGTNEIVAADHDDGREAHVRQKEILQMAMDLGLIASSMRCPPCGNRAMKLSRTSKVKDMWRWRCTSCKKERSVRSEAFFKDANVGIPDWLRFIGEWSRNSHATIEQLRASTSVRVSDRTAGSMLKCTRDMSDRMAYEWPEEQLGGNGAAVAVFAIGEKCKAGHAIQLFVSDVAIHMVHNHVPMPIKPNSRIFTDFPAPLQVPANCIVMGLNQCPIDLGNKREEAAQWWRLHRGVACGNSVAHGIAGEYTIRSRYFAGAADMFTDIFSGKLRQIYAPVFSAL